MRRLALALLLTAGCLPGPAGQALGEAALQTSGVFADQTPGKSGPGYCPAHTFWNEQQKECEVPPCSGACTSTEKCVVTDHWEHCVALSE